MTIEARKRAVLNSLYAIGESHWAADFRDSTSAESYATLERIMRTALKARGPDDPHWANVVAHAIVECQLLPHAAAEPDAKVDDLDNLS